MRRFRRLGDPVGESAGHACLPLADL